MEEDGRSAEEGEKDGEWMAKKKEITVLKLYGKKEGASQQKLQAKRLTNERHS